MSRIGFPECLWTLPDAVRRGEEMSMVTVRSEVEMTPTKKVGRTFDCSLIFHLYAGYYFYGRRMLDPTDPAGETLLEDQIGDLDVIEAEEGDLSAASGAGGTAVDKRKVICKGNPKIGEIICKWVEELEPSLSGSGCLREKKFVFIILGEIRLFDSVGVARTDFLDLALRVAMQFAEIHDSWLYLYLPSATTLQELSLARRYYFNLAPDSAREIVTLPDGSVHPKREFFAEDAAARGLDVTCILPAYFVQSSRVRREIGPFFGERAGGGVVVEAPLSFPPDFDATQPMKISYVKTPPAATSTRHVLYPHPDAPPFIAENHFLLTPPGKTVSSRFCIRVVDKKTIDPDHEDGIYGTTAERWLISVTDSEENILQVWKWIETPCFILVDDIEEEDDEEDSTSAESAAPSAGAGGSSHTAVAPAKTKPDPFNGALQHQMVTMLRVYAKAKKKPIVGRFNDHFAYYLGQGFQVIMDSDYPFCTLVLKKYLLSKGKFPLTPDEESHVDTAREILAERLGKPESKITDNDFKEFWNWAEPLGGSSGLNLCVSHRVERMIHQALAKNPNQYNLEIDSAIKNDFATYLLGLSVDTLMRDPTL